MARHGFARRGRQRREGNREAKQHTIIICYDGERTEADYFIGWRRQLGNVGVVVRPYLVKSGGNALEAVRASVDIKRADRDHDEFWCVCDVDDTSSQDLNEAIALAGREAVNLCLSRRSFEVWIALHWERIPTAEILTERQARSLVARYHADYEHGTKSIEFGVLFPRTPDAIVNAKWLAQQGLNNPATSVHLLVEKLLERVPKA